MYWTSVMLRLWSEWNPRGQSGMYLRMTSLVEYLMCVVSPTRTLDPDLRGPRGFNALFKLGARGTDMGVMYKKFGRFSQWLGRRIVDHDSYCIALFIEVPCYPSIHSIHVALRNEETIHHTLMLATRRYKKLYLDTKVATMGSDRKRLTFGNSTSLKASVSNQEYKIFQRAGKATSRRTSRGHERENNHDFAALITDDMGMDKCDDQRGKRNRDWWVC